MQRPLVRAKSGANTQRPVGNHSRQVHRITISGLIEFARQILLTLDPFSDHLHVCYADAKHFFGRRTVIDEVLIRSTFPFFFNSVMTLATVPMIGIPEHRESALVGV
jgi:hypothetical protein